MLQELGKALAVERIAVCLFTGASINSPEKGVQVLGAIDIQNLPGKFCFASKAAIFVNLTTAHA